MNITQIKQTTLPGSVSGVVLVSTVCLAPGQYETMALRRDFLDVDEAHDSTEAAALASHDHMVKSFTPVPAPAPAPDPVLSGKYARLRDDLRAAHAMAETAAAAVDDGGACNFDAVSLRLPRWKESLVKQAAREAGCGCFVWNSYGGRRYVFPHRCPGQAYKSEVAADTMTAELARRGYEALTYCQLD